MQTHAVNIFPFGGCSTNDPELQEETVFACLWNFKVKEIKAFEITNSTAFSGKSYSFCRTASLRSHENEKNRKQTH
jgi:hypothetical protein